MIRDTEYDLLYSRFEKTFDLLKRLNNWKNSKEVQSTFSLVGIHSYAPRISPVFSKKIGELNQELKDLLGEPGDFIEKGPICEACQGKGYQLEHDVNGHFDYMVNCTPCSGEGYLGTKQ